MSKAVRFSVDDVECIGEEGQWLLDAARANGIYIPSLCYLQGFKPRGGCRVCTVLVNGRTMASCTTPLANGMKVENNTPELNDMRKAMIELMLVEGNHLCPSCVKSGNCALQALAYHYQVMAPRFPYQYPVREIDVSADKVMVDHNRCILCRRCTRAVKTADGKTIFGTKRRGHRSYTKVDPELGKLMTDEQALYAMEVCPVGSILYKGKGYDLPIGKRRYDSSPIGIDHDGSVVPTNGKDEQ